MFKLYSLTLLFAGSGLLCFLNAGNMQVFLTFMLNLICITMGLYRAISCKKVNLDVIIWFFVYTFFFLAPVIQINYSSYFPNSMPIESSYVVKANLLIFLWNVIYLLFRKKRVDDGAGEAVGETVGEEVREAVRESSGNSSAANHNLQLETMLDTISWQLKTIYFVVSLIIFAMTFALFKFPYFLGHADYDSIISNKSLLLLANIGLPGIVFANWIFAFVEIRKKYHVWNVIYIIVSSLIAIYQINPLNSSRFYIGFSVIMIIYMFYHKKITSGGFILYIFIGLFVVFPLLNFFRFGFSEFEMPSLNELMFKQLTQLHFDAYSNIVATLKYCEVNGISYGYEMLGVLLFFVPRSIWASKPLSSGEAVGDFISGQYALKFNNLSNPIMSEFYKNFGWLGVMGGALLIAFLVNRFESPGRADRYTYSLIAGYLFMIYRGDLMSAFAYSFGTYVIMVLVPSWAGKAGRMQKLQKVKNLGNERREFKGIQL
ncbi:oligosaccharide repeat unit polymerase [Paenibacillus eucommiae]|uniref:Oligosaccharide repeat unit polymerase n=1 Tax=Paenibacillus eucommiae TaxID=1355755 RepID=A0ABS4J2A6_9BACL|nr:oligosaccharide repeat unit polymerase [Paenibacillus eucommiae]MBP1993962.1 oligosaccharide repeat unit polymerase [Paenibacillus eucommiae]